ncbi:Gfo/Idh/MocA family oxidoreductase [Sphingobacterium sp. LRF_L2]|uniref:Gfo/Idh/MocA family oxidoreductase n=1 Tax=Sphingobacterium sp. LRF_L2 TaxID=3369421 RepID=UPI003F62C095
MIEKKINTVILGYGFSGSIFFAPFFDLHPAFELHGAVERNRKRIQIDYPQVKSYNAVDEVWKDASVELVVVNTPIETHFELAKQSLLAGKHTIVEKTFTNTAAQALALYELAKEKNLHLFVYQNRRWDSDFLTTKKVLETGKLGNIVEASISYDIFLPELRGDVHTEQPASGGEFNNRGSHVVDQAIYLFGLPEAVFAGFAAFRKSSPVEDYFEIILFYSDKRVKVRATDISFMHQPAYILHGTEGSFIKLRSDIQEERLLKGEKPKENAWSVEPEEMRGRLSYMEEGEKVVLPVDTEDGNYYAYFESVYQTMRNSAPIAVSGLDGYKTMLVMDAARESVLKKCIVKVAPKIIV